MAPACRYQEDPRACREEQTDCHDALGSLLRSPQEKAQIICSYRFSQTHTLDPQTGSFK